MRIRSLSVVVLTAMLAHTSLASAQDAPAADTPATTPKGDPKEAQDHFQRARTLYDEGDFKLALVEFKRAYELSPNYRVLYNIGQVSIQLQDYAAALRTLERYLEEGGTEVPASRKAQVDADIKMLVGRTAYLSVTTKPPADISIDDQPAGHAPFREPLLVNAGPRKITASKPGFLPTTRNVTLAGGDRQDVSMELTPVPKDQVFVVQSRTEKSYTPAIVGWTATGALAVTTVILGVIALGKKSDLDEFSKPTNLVRPDDRLKAESSATTFSVATDIFAIATVAVGAVATYFTLRPPMTTSNEAAPPKPAVTWSPSGLRATF